MSAEGYVPFPAFAEWSSLPVDTAVFDGYAAVLDRLRAEADPAALKRAVRAATRLAAIDTGAIEGLYEVDRGFTMTVALGATAWEAAIDAREPVVRRSFDDALRAYDFVLDLATGRSEISAKAIREIHSIICAGQDTHRVWTSAGWQEQALPRGEYKSLPNNPTRTATGRKHFYAPPSDTPGEMDRLVGELRSEEFAAAHPVLQAAYAHYAFVAVHPFADGNGRVSRALASVYLYRRPGAPLVIFADQKDEYIDALEEADAGVPRRFVRFVSDRVADVVGVVQVTTDAGTGSTAESLASLGAALLRGDGLPATELDAIALRIYEAARNEVLDRFAALPLPAGVSATEKRQLTMSPGLSVPYDFARPPGWRQLALSAPTGSVQRHLGVAVDRSGRAAPAFVLITEDNQLPVELRDIYPTATSVFTIKLRAWAEGLVNRLLAELADQVR